MQGCENRQAQRLSCYLVPGWVRISKLKKGGSKVAEKGKKEAKIKKADDNCNCGCSAEKR